jgi:hypothetical protein
MTKTTFSDFAATPVWKTRLDHQRLRAPRGFSVFRGKEPSHLHKAGLAYAREGVIKRLPAFAVFAEDMTAIEITGRSP